MRLPREGYVDMSRARSGAGEEEEEEEEAGDESSSGNQGGAEDPDEGPLDPDEIQRQLWQLQYKRELDLSAHLPPTSPSFLLASSRLLSLRFYGPNASKSLRAWKRPR